VYSTAFAAKKDTVAPSVTNSYPKNDETDIMIESTVLIRFDEKIQKGKTIAKISFVDAASKSVAFTYEIKDSRLMIIPKDKLIYNTEYKIILPAGAIKDGAGTPLAAAYELCFLTEESSAVESIQEDNSNNAADNEDNLQDTGTINLKLDIDAFIMDNDFDSYDKYMLRDALYGLGIVVRNITSEKISQSSQIEYENYNLILEDAGTAKVQVTKALRELFALSLSDARDIADRAPCILAEGLPLDMAQEYKKRLEEAGASVTIMGNEAVSEEDNDENQDTAQEAVADNSSEQATEQEDIEDVSNEDADTLKDVILVSSGDNRMAVIKVLRGLMTATSAEIQNIVYNAPIKIFEGITLDRAENIEIQLQSVGAEVDIIDHEEAE
jgi:ribosomal protein L7/L12